jgi:hypothetical protein
MRSSACATWAIGVAGALDPLTGPRHARVGWEAGRGVDLVAWNYDTPVRVAPRRVGFAQTARRACVAVVTRHGRTQPVCPARVASLARVRGAGDHAHRDFSAARIDASAAHTVDTLATEADAVVVGRAARSLRPVELAEARATTARPVRAWGRLANVEFLAIGVAPACLVAGPSRSSTSVQCPRRQRCPRRCPRDMPAMPRSPQRPPTGANHSSKSWLRLSQLALAVNRSAARLLPRRLGYSDARCPKDDPCAH